MSNLKPDSIGAIPPQQGSSNRGYDNRVDADEAPPIQITLEIINEIILDYLKTTINPTLDDNGNSRPVDVLYGIPERWASIRKDGFLRDSNTNQLLAPLIMIRRTNVSRTSPLNPNNKYVHAVLESGYTARNAYNKFDVMNRIAQPKKLRQVIIPDYMTLEYDVILWAEYQAQMDTLIEQINVESEEFWGKRNNYKFRVTINEFVDQSEMSADKNRVIRTTFKMQVQAYLIPERMIRNFEIASTNSTTYTSKKTIIMVESVSDIKKVP